MARGRRLRYNGDRGVLFFGNDRKLGLTEGTTDIVRITHRSIACSKRFNRKGSESIRRILLTIQTINADWSVGSDVDAKIGYDAAPTHDRCVRYWHLAY